MDNLVNVVIPPLQDAYTYLIPATFLDSVEVGCQVEVSFGRRQAAGFVVARYEEKITKEKFPYELKPLNAGTLPVRSFHPAQLDFFRWIADYYGDSLASVIDVAVPASVEAKMRRDITVLKRAGAAPKGPREREILTALEADASLSFEALHRRFKSVVPVLKRLEEKGFISMTSTEVVDLAFANEKLAAWAKKSVSLNTAQEKATAEITESVRKKEFAPFLLHGVTGSGKTEVYIEAIRVAMSAGRGALIIVPEIALTPQLIDRFRARLGNELAILHSALGKRQRWNSWRALLEGRAHVAIGARSGIFAPVQNLGLIIVDEEHDSSYKQNEGLRYNARDLAVVLAKMRNCPVVLGSATPSLESVHSAYHTKRYRLLELQSRHGAPTADISLVDLHQVKPWEKVSNHISPPLALALSQTLERKEQAFILYNRRGFASYLQCTECETVIECENCSVTMTYHRNDNTLLCHYCGLSVIVPQYCPECNATASTKPQKKAEKKGTESMPAETTEPKVGTLEERGAGTEKIYDEVVELFPAARVERLDRDSASDHDTYRAILDRLRNHEIDILVGTQMIAKGHDLPNVTLVGIADCDVGLHLPDFRASERVFQLLTQAAGRAGRGDKPGQVILQTRKPHHPSLVMTRTNNFEGFCEVELKNRKFWGYPPFTRLLRVVVSSQDKTLPRKILEMYKAEILQLQTDTKFTVLGPATTPIKKIKTLWREHMLIKSESAATINRIVQKLCALEVKSNKARITLDVDPQEML